MVRAGEPPSGCARRLGDERRAPVLAGVVERADLPVVAADEHDGLAQLDHLEVRPRLGQLVGVRHHQPAASEDLLVLERREPGIGVAARRHRWKHREPGRVRVALRLLGGAALDLIDQDRGHRHGWRPSLRQASTLREDRPEPGREQPR